MTSEQLTEAIAAATPDMRESVDGWIAISTQQAEVLRFAAQQLLDQRQRLERLGPERLAEMRHYVWIFGPEHPATTTTRRMAAMIRDMLHVIGEAHE